MSQNIIQFPNKKERKKLEKKISREDKVIRDRRKKNKKIIHDLKREQCEIL